MTQIEFDNLVRRIGDEILGRLGAAPAATVPLTPSSCGCGTAPAIKLVPSGSPTVLSGDWSPPKEGVAGFIDHTLLAPAASEADVVRLCGEAKQHGFCAVCVHPSWVARALRELRGSKVKTATVVGFPHGATVTPVKLAETEQVLRLGAREIDMVIHAGALKAGDLDYVYHEIHSVADQTHAAGSLLKVILETALLSEEQKINGCVVAKIAGADFVKTSTGFGPAGADPQDVALMRRVVGPEMGVKAAGGIRSFQDFCVMMASGATRIGTSAGVGIVKQAASNAVR